MWYPTLTTSQLTPPNLIACPVCEQFRGVLFEVEWCGQMTLSCDQTECINKAILVCAAGTPNAPLIVPILGTCKCCHDQNWFPDHDPNHRCHKCQDVKCEACEKVEGVELEDSRTMYDPGPVTFWERILLDGEERPDPNRPRFLCRDCAADHHAHWDEMWKEYYSGLL